MDAKKFATEHRAGSSSRRLSADEVHELDLVRKAIGELTPRGSGATRAGENQDDDQRTA